MGKQSLNGGVGGRCVSSTLGRQKGGRLDPSQNKVRKTSAKKLGQDGEEILRFRPVGGEEKLNGREKPGPQ